VIRRLVAADSARTNKPFEPVVRERLLERFDVAAAYRIVLVAAPAGFGKSVAVRHYLEHRRIDHVRCALRREHDSLLGVLGAFAAAVERIAPNMLHAYSSFYSNVEQSPTIARGVAQWIATMLKSYRGAIFIDDLHHARSDPRVAEMLMEVVDLTHGDVRWFFAARDPQTFPVATWLAYGAIDVPIDETDLRLTIDEAAAAAREVEVSLTQETLRELLSLTDGWATAFTFALRASTRTSELARVALGTREMVYAFLAEQVFRSLDEADRDFLLRTAPLPALDLRVLREADFEDAPATIARLRRTTAFVVDESDRVFRYHDLFRDFVEHELRRNAARYARACDDAATWSLQAGRTVEALKLYGESGNGEAIVCILESRGAELFDRGEVKLLEGILESLEPARVERSPLVLALGAMISALRGRLELADAAFQRALALDCNPDAKAHIAMRYATTLSLRWRSADALAAVSSIDAERIVSMPLRARFLAFRAYALSGVRRPEAGKLAAEALALARGIEDVTLEVMVLQYTAFVAMNERRFQESNSYAGEALRLAELNKLFGPASRVAMLLASIASEVGDSDANLWHITRMRRNAEQVGDVVAINWATMIAYGIHTVRGDVDRIESLEPALAELTAPSRGLEHWPALLSAIAMQHAWAGNFVEAYNSIASSGNYAGELPDAAWRNAIRWAEIGLYAAAAGKREAGESALKRFNGLAATMSDDIFCSYPMLEARLVIALAAILMERSTTANNIISAVERELAKTDESIKAFARAVRALYVRAETGVEYDSLITALQRLSASRMGGYAKLIEALPFTVQPSANAFSSLTPTELKVLASIAHGATSKEIAIDMGRSALTIDSHVKSIIRKLGCSGRRSAVALARDKGIV
jgi:ATP/maltotriose-dependent transcriptional regulator MalT